MGRRALMLCALTAAALWPFGAGGATDRGQRALARAAINDRTSTVCTWGGTPANTTGTLTVKPGLTFTPSTDDLKFGATGDLAGGPGCTGTMTFDGVIEAGSTCAHQIFDGKVKGLPGVERFYGPGAAGFVYEFLYDKDGRIVGADQPQVLTGTGQGSELSDCNTADGFTEGMFSSTVEIWGP